ncbi:MAG: FAD-dependent oxidoreductase [Eubacteriales bacterium]|nr:FAD-dependent oxidoreductase [Kiritimatiellia bacterium]MDD4494133.1 FAD-dependent oxidoreductase [Eubacteriales bacterium]
MTRRLDGATVLDDKHPHDLIISSIGITGDWRRCGPAFAIPFEALYGKKILNLITAGRCISVTDDMWDITRVIPCCAVTGQAAGTAAAMCDDYAEFDVRELQEHLKNDGVRLN